MARGFRHWLLRICLVLVAMVAIATPSWAISGKSYGDEWLATDAATKRVYCERAYNAFRSAPSSSYIISANVQGMNPDKLCQRLDLFYSFDINAETRLDEAAGLAPLLFSDLPL